tara:strand:- start:160 stop:624 length:465 start_codon:yes stop_codon:yes gene_type:complete
MLRHLLYILPLMAWSCASGPTPEEVAAQQAKLEVYRSWHTSQFYYKERPFGVFLVNRNDTFQEEFIRSNGMLVEFSLNWLNDSMYEMRYDTIKENPKGILLPDELKSMIRICKMTAVNDTSYIEQAVSNLTSDTVYTKYRRPKAVMPNQNKRLP